MNPSEEEYVTLMKRRIGTNLQPVQNARKFCNVLSALDKNSINQLCVDVY